MEGHCQAGRIKQRLAARNSGTALAYPDSKPDGAWREALVTIFMVSGRLIEN